MEQQEENPQFTTSEGVPVFSKDVNAEPSATPVKERCRVSKFFITINSNKVARDLDEANATADCLKKAFQAAFKEHIEDMVRMPDPFTPEFVKAVDLKYAAEIGPKQDRIHLHGIVTFKHHSHIQLRYKVIGDFLKAHCGMNVYFNAQFIPSDMFSDYYLEK